jgi:hypothetical protein
LVNLAAVLGTMVKDAPDLQSFDVRRSIPLALGLSTVIAPDPEASKITGPPALVLNVVPQITLGPAAELFTTERCDEQPAASAAATIVATSAVCRRLTHPGP